MRVQAAHPDHLEWIAKRARISPGPAMRAIEAVDASGKIHGMVAYDGWAPNSVCMHIALDNPLALRSLLRPGFGIPFDEFGRGVALATVISSNKRSMALVPKLGFTEKHRVKDGWERGVDIVLFEMRREDCRWILPAKLRKAG